MKHKRKTLLGISSAKTQKGEKLGYLTGILYLAPHKIAGFNVCPNASEGCAAACLYISGMGKFTSVQLARIAKTQYLRSDKEGFLWNLRKDIIALERKAKRDNMIPVVRLNGTSDLPWENMGIIQEFPNIQFYDYTKSFKRMGKYLSGEMPANYHLTFSASEENRREVLRVLRMGGNVAIVFDKLPGYFLGKKVINADKHDLRFLDESNVICGLTFKGSKKDRLEAIRSGFVYKS